MKSSRSIETSSTFTRIIINPATIHIICIPYIWQLLLKVWARTCAQYGVQIQILIDLQEIEQNWNHPSCNSDLIMYSFVSTLQEPVLIC
jgi:hypothetical protein